MCRRHRLARDELQRWSIALKETCSTQQHHERKESKEEASVSSHQAAVIRVLVETAQDTAQAPAEVSAQPPSEEESEVSATIVSKSRKTAPSTHLASVWFEWYADIRRGWLSRDRKKKSETELVVAYMKLFLPRGFDLSEGDTTYRDRVLELGHDTE